MSYRRLLTCKGILPVLLLLIFPSTILAINDQSDVENLKQLQNIESAKDSSIDPCDDFYTYACGRYSNPQQSLFQVHENYLKSVQQILKTQFPDIRQIKTYNQSYAEKLRIYLHSCLEKGDVDVSEYFFIVKPKKGVEWPLFEEVKIYNDSNGSKRRQPWLSNKYDVFELLGKLSNYGLNNDIIQADTEK